MLWPIWDVISDEERQLLCEINFKHFGVLPEIKPRKEHRYTEEQDEVLKEVVQTMQARPHFKNKRWRS